MTLFLDEGFCGIKPCTPSRHSFRSQQNIFQHSTVDSVAVEEKSQQQQLCQCTILIDNNGSNSKRQNMSGVMAREEPLIKQLARSRVLVRPRDQSASPVRGRLLQPKLSMAPPIRSSSQPPPQSQRMASPPARMSPPVYYQASAIRSHTNDVIFWG